MMEGAGAYCQGAGGRAGSVGGREMWRVGRKDLAGEHPVLPLSVVGAPAGRREDVLAQARPGAAVEDAGGAAGGSRLS